MADDTEDDDYDTMIDDTFDTVSDEEEEGDSATRLLSPARTLAVRRAIEARLEQKQLAAAFDYLEIDIEDEE